MNTKTPQPGPTTQKPPHDKNKHQDIPTPPNKTQNPPSSDSYAEIHRQQQDRPGDKQRI